MYRIVTWPDVGYPAKLSMTQLSQRGFYNNIGLSSGGEGHWWVSPQEMQLCQIGSGREARPIGATKIS